MGLAKGQKSFVGGLAVAVVEFYSYCSSTQNLLELVNPEEFRPGTPQSPRIAVLTQDHSHDRQCDLPQTSTRHCVSFVACSQLPYLQWLQSSFLELTQRLTNLQESVQKGGNEAPHNTQVRYRRGSLSKETLESSSSGTNPR